MKKLTLLVLATVVCVSLYAQKWADPAEIEFTELSDSKPIDAQAWDRLPNGVSVSWASTDVRYSRDNAPKIVKPTAKNSVKGWRGERVNMQFLVWSKSPMKDISFEIGAFKNKKGQALPDDAVKAGFLRYVMTDPFLVKGSTNGCGVRTDKSVIDSSIVADMIHYKSSLSTSARATRPVWVTVWIPQSATPGIYQSDINVKANGQLVGTLTASVEVQNRLLPAPKDWAFHLDLWQNPFAVARYFDVPLWSKEHFDAMTPTFKQLASAGQKVITTSIMHKPWGGQTEDYFETMVTWIKKADGSWSFDYTVFDKWVEYMMSLGIDQQINCYSMIPWKLSFQYFDQASNTLKFIETKPGEAAYEDMWFAMLSSFSDHLRKKGWFDITTIGIDERPLEAMQRTLEVIKKADPAFKMSLAGNYHKELINELHDYSIPVIHSYGEGDVASRRSQGKHTTYYTCCSDHNSNMFTSSDPADATWIAWNIAASGLDGYLRWAYNSWVLDPLTDSRFRTWAAGDTYCIYPSGNSSIRFERFVEGIQDFEKVRILREEFTKSGDKKALAQIDKALSLFDYKKFPELKPETPVNQARAIINEL